MFIGDDSTLGHRKQTSEMRYERTPTSFMKVEELSEARRHRVLIWARLFEHGQKFRVYLATTLPQKSYHTRLIYMTRFWQLRFEYM